MSASETSMKLPAETASPSNASTTAPQKKDSRLSCKAIAEQFCHQYYTVFSSYPRYLYRFYDQSSVQTITEVFEDGTSNEEFSNTQKAIHDAIARHFNEARVNYSDILSQFSQNEGVMIQVSGTLSRMNHKDSNFVQSFFLAVQERGFFVANDILNITPRSGKPSPNNKNSKFTNETVPRVKTPCNGRMLVTQIAKSSPNPDPQQVSQILAETKELLNSTVIQSSAKDPFYSTSTSSSVDGTQHSPVSRHSKSASCGEVPVNIQDGFLLPSRPKTGGSVSSKNSSVFVRDIPSTATERELREVFEGFGAVTSAVIRTGKRDSRFAFVDFAEAESMLKALASDCVLFQGRRLGIQEKKPIVIRRGKYQNPRGGEALECASSRQHSFRRDQTEQVQN